MKIYLKPVYMNSLRIISGILWLVGTTVNLIAQNNETVILRQFDSYRKSALQEKMFVHTDKEYYLAGEICWFKIYLVDAAFHKPLDISKVAYAELLDDTNKPVVQAKIALEKGDGNGSLYMPFTLNSGNYKLRVYSKWMKNFSADYFFEKTISIINSQKITELPVTLQKNDYDVQFFPEGGNLVNGLKSKIAFRVADQNGKGVDCNAVVVNDRKDTVLKFHTMIFGMGSFNLMPFSGEHYSAYITMPDGLRIVRDLPRAYKNGYTMSLAADGEKQVKITVRLVADELVQTPSSVYLLVHTRGSVKAAESAGIQNGLATFLIDREKLGDGISHFTIFNSNRKPVCERLYFKYPQKKVIVKIITDENIYKERQRINIDIFTNDQNDKPVDANLSMAVYRIDSLQLPTEGGISEYLWLTSDIPGSVESPDYYFNTIGPATTEAMDNLMLTNGWRRFRWEDVLNNKKPYFKFAPEYNGHLINGKIVNSKAASGAANINTFLSVPGTNQFRTSQSDGEGDIKFEMKSFYGTPGIIVQTNTEKDSTYHIEIDNPFSGEYSVKQMPSFLFPAKNPETLIGQSIGMQVENIYHGDNLKMVKNGRMDTSSFYQQPNAIYLLDNYTRFATMEEVLREYVFPVNVRKKGGRYHLPVYNDADKFNSLFENDPLVLLDGVPVFNMDKLLKYDPLKVWKLEAVTRRYYYGNMTFDGIVNLVTYNGELEGYELDPQAVVMEYEALQSQRIFYSPVYETTQQTASHLPDFRNVLSWLPEIRTDKYGKYHNSFYTSDLPGKYVAVVQSITTDGKTGSNRIFFEVKMP